MKQQEFDKLYFEFWNAELIGTRVERECDLIVQIAGLAPGASVLDLGAGFGRISFTLAERGYALLPLNVAITQQPKPRRENTRNVSSSKETGEIAHGTSNLIAS
jgi:cyclopropane fatty-acyl-phospholipid synthase-like methyltransferase